MPRIEPIARIANGGAIRAAASISIAPAPKISASRIEIFSVHSPAPEAHSDQLRPSEDLFSFSYIAVLRSVALDRSTPGFPKSARCAAPVELAIELSNQEAFRGCLMRRATCIRRLMAPVCTCRLSCSGWQRSARRPTYAPRRRRECIQSDTPLGIRRPDTPLGLG